MAVAARAGVTVPPTAARAIGAPGRPASAVPERPSPAKLYGLLALMLFIWSINYVIAKAAVRDAPAFLVVCLRTTLSGVLMAALFRPRPARDAGVRSWTWRDVPRLLAIGAGGIVGNQCLFVIGLGLTSVAHGAILAALGPVLILLGSAALGTERLTRRKVVGSVVAALGVVVLQLGRSSNGHASLGGDGLMVASTLLFTGFAVFGKRAAAEVGATALNLVGYVGGALLLLPFTIWQITVHPLAHLGATAWLGVLFMGTCPSIVGYMIYAYALRWLPASRVATVSYLQPIFATAFAVLLLGERPGLGFAAAAALVLGGVWIAQRPIGAVKS